MSRSSIFSTVRRALVCVIVAASMSVGCGGGTNGDPRIDLFDGDFQSQSLTFDFEWEVSDPDGDPLTCTLDVDSDGTAEYTIDDCEMTTAQAHEFTELGPVTATLEVTDTDGATASATLDIDVVCPDPIQVEEGDVEQDETFPNVYMPMDCVDYGATGDIGVSGTVTFEPGVVMAFDGGTIKVGGSQQLDASGTDELPIIWTASESDGSWGGVSARGAVSLDRVTIEQAGAYDFTSSNYDAPASITLRDGAALEMQNSMVRDGEGYGVFSDDESSVPVFENNTVTGHALGPVRTDINVAHQFSGSSSYTDNDVEGISVNPDYGTIEGDVTWDALDTPWVITREISTPSLYVPEDASLTLEAGARIEFEENVALRVPGTLQASGTANNPVVLTARTPDSAPWGGLVVSSDGQAVLDATEITHAGGTDLTSSNYDVPANIVVRGGGTLELSNSTVSDSNGTGIFSDLDSNIPVFDGNTITANAETPVYTDTPIAHAYGATSSYTGNGTDAILVNPRHGEVVGERTWEATDVPFRVVQALSTPRLTVPSGNTLTLSPGARVELEPGVGIRVEGSLVSEGTEQNRIQITNVPQQSNFLGVVIYDGTGTFAYTTIENGGSADVGFDDVKTNVLLTSFTSDDNPVATATFGEGMEQSGAPYGLAFDNYGGSAGTTMASGSGCSAMAPIYYADPNDKTGQCN